MKSKAHGLTRDQVIKFGEYLGFKEYGSGATEQFWKIDGLVFSEVCDAGGMRAIFRCVGKDSKVLPLNL